MNPDEIRNQLQDFVKKTIKEELALVSKNLQNLIAIGIIREINTTGQLARVQLISSGGILTPFIPYPKNFTSAQIGVGQKVVVISPDPSIPTSAYIVGGYGGF